MRIEMVRDGLLWVQRINYGVLIGWWLRFLLAHDWMYRWTVAGFISRLRSLTL